MEHSRRLTRLKQQLASLSANNQTNDGESLSNRNQIKNEIESILASDCLFCGELMIQNIDKPFIVDWDQENLDWQ